LSNAAFTPAVNLGGVFVGLGEGVGVDEGMGAASFFGSTFTPLFQTNLFARLMHLYFFALKILVTPWVEQLAPGFGEGAAAALAAEISRANIGMRARTYIKK